MPVPRLRRSHVVFAQLVVAATLLGLSQTQWLDIAATAAAGSLRISGTGSEVAPLVQACAIVLAASALAGALARRRAAMVAMIVAAAAAAGAAAAAIHLSLNADDAAARAVSDATGVSQGATASVVVWTYLAAAVAVVGLAVSLAGLAARPRQATARFEQPAAAGTAPAQADDDPAAAWDALSRGEDPTDAADRTGATDPTDSGDGRER